MADTIRIEVRIEGSGKRRERVAMARFMAAWLILCLGMAWLGVAAMVVGRLHHIDHAIEVAERV